MSIILGSKKVNEGRLILLRRAFFSRVDVTTSYSSLVIEAKRQMKVANRPMNYKIIAQIYVPDEQFNIIIHNVITPIPQYIPYYINSITSSTGIWQCIEVKSTSDIRGIVVYMGGRTFPLYAAPLFDGN